MLLNCFVIFDADKPHRINRFLFLSSLYKYSVHKLRAFTDWFLDYSWAGAKDKQRSRSLNQLCGLLCNPSATNLFSITYNNVKNLRQTSRQKASCSPLKSGSPRSEFPPLVPVLVTVNAKIQSFSSFFTIFCKTYDSYRFLLSAASWLHLYCPKFVSATALNDEGIDKY